MALDTSKTSPDGDGDRLCEHGLSDAGYIFDQQMAGGENGCGRGDDRVSGAKDDGVQVCL